MAQLRARSHGTAVNSVGRGRSGYALHGERYVLPALPGLLCPACEKHIHRDLATGMFVCENCEARFTSVDMQKSIRWRARRDFDRNQKARAEQLQKQAEADRLCRILRDTGATAVVYYIRFRDTVKIGTSTDVAKRLTMHPWEELLALEPGGLRVEKRRHRDLHAARLDGEWFELTDAVRAHIAEVNRENATWFANLFSETGSLPAMKADVRFPPLSDYPRV